MEPTGSSSGVLLAPRTRMGILQALEENGVEYVLLAHESGGDARLPPTLRRQVEICFQQRWENCSSLNRALEELDARSVVPGALTPPWTGQLRMAPSPLLFETPCGALLALPEVPGLGAYEELILWARSRDVRGLLGPVRWVPASAEALSPLPSGG